MKKDLPQHSDTPRGETASALKKEGRHFLFSVFDFVFLNMRSKYKKSPLEFFVLFIGGFVLSVLISAFILLVLFQKIDVNISVPAYSFGAPSFLSFSGNSSRVLASKMDPVVLLGMIKKNSSDYVLIDVRSANEFNQGHIKTAISIPVYGTKFLRADGSIDKKGLKEAFAKSIKNKKQIVLYGQSQYSAYPEVIIKALKLKNAQVLSVGWNEWMHFKNLWIPESEWNRIDINNYVQIKE